ncbi:MAG: hypothetical protein AAB600_00090 [Patescibacteria group bacterium]
MILKSKDRGKFLSLLLALSFFGILASAPQAVDPDVMSRFHGMLPVWYRLWVTIYLVSQIVVLIGIWKRKRFAVYAFFLLSGIQVVLISTALKPIYDSHIIAIAVFAMWQGLWVWAIKRKWHIFI